MPFAQIYLLEGRTEDQKRAVIEKVTQALQEAVARRRRTSASGSTTCPRPTGASRARLRRTSVADRPMSRSPPVHPSFSPSDTVTRVTENEWSP